MRRAISPRLAIRTRRIGRISADAPPDERVESRSGRGGALRPLGLAARGGALLSFDLWTMASMASRPLPPPPARGGFRGGFLGRMVPWFLVGMLSRVLPRG